jgi:hypothetical protein
MNPFVDTQKRGIELPFACKDLAEVLATTDRQLGSKDRWKLLNGLQETERYLARLLLMPMALSSLDIDLRNTPHHLLLRLVGDELCAVLLVAGSDRSRLARVRKLFRDGSVHPIVDELYSFGAISESSTRILIYPLPVVATDAAELVTRVIREGFAISEEMQLHISHTEKSIT